VVRTPGRAALGVGDEGSGYRRDGCTHPLPGAWRRVRGDRALYSSGNYGSNLLAPTSDLSH